VKRRKKTRKNLGKIARQVAKHGRGFGVRNTRGEMLSGKSKAKDKKVLKKKRNQEKQKRAK